MKRTNYSTFILALTVSIFAGACGSTLPMVTNGAGTGTTTTGIPAGTANSCDGFGGSVADNAGVTYNCVDQAGALYEMKFDGNGGFIWYFITTGNPPVLDGSYEVVGGDQVRITIPGFDVGGADFEETSNRTVVKLGMLAGFETSRISCGAIRHDFDINTMDRADYQCNPYSVGPGVTHFPVFRLGGLEGTRESPLYNQSQPGAAFWSTQKDIAGSIVNEDYYGIYRQIGNQVCMYFPGAPIDRQEVQADFSNDLSTLSVDRAELNQTGPCSRI